MRHRLVVGHVEIATETMREGTRYDEAWTTEAIQRLWLLEHVLWPSDLGLVHAVNDDGQDSGVA